MIEKTHYVKKLTFGPRKLIDYPDIELYLFILGY